MRVKKFEAKNMKDALRMVKNELGPDAVILSARDNRKSFGLGGEASVEVTAAVSENTLQKKHFVESRMTTADRTRFSNSDARVQREIISHMVESRVKESQPKPARRPITSVSYIDIPDETEQSPRRQKAMEKATGRNVRELLDDFEQDFRTDAATDRLQERPTPAVAREVGQLSQQDHGAPPMSPSSENALSRIRSAAREAWAAGVFTAGAFGPEDVKKLSKTETSNGTTSGGLEVHAGERSPLQEQEISSLKGEIDRLHKMLEGFQKVPQSFVTMHPGADFGIPYDLSFMFEKLTSAGVTIDHSVDILQVAMKELDAMQMKKRPFVDAWVARWFLNHVQTVAQPFAGRLHLFVGGSGSGKTSTLVKLASHLVVKEKRKVAILTTDSFKVGAVDQLKIYCQILNVPFAVIRSRKDWEWVLGQLANVDHVLVDFPGFQLRELEQIHLLKSLLPPAESQPATHFCVSATSKDGDAFDTARRYKVTDYHDLIFTNLDQSVQHGIVYNLHKKTGKPLHSFGIGSRIPEDFEPATKERVLDLIFRLTKLKREMK